jgi:hypothetical protein
MMSKESRRSPVAGKLRHGKRTGQDVRQRKLSRAMQRKIVSKCTGGHIESRAICLNGKNGLYSTPVSGPTWSDANGDGRLPSVSRAGVPRAEQTRRDSAIVRVFLIDFVPTTTQCSTISDTVRKFYSRNTLSCRA